MQYRPSLLGLVGRLATPWAFLGLVYFLTSHSDLLPWALTNVLHPLGRDEFSRDSLSALIEAAVLSLIKGSLLASITFAIAIAIASFISFTRSVLLRSLVDFLADAFESIPILLWILLFVVIFNNSRVLITFTAFVVAVLPGAIRLIRGEFQRLLNEEYVLSAIALGGSRSQIVVRHILPNSMALLAPAAIQLLGNAIAIDGAIGLLGMGSREDLDLGVFLLRGKEQFFTNTALFLSAASAYIALYWYLVWMTGLTNRFFLYKSI